MAIAYTIQEINTKRPIESRLRALNFCEPIYKKTGQPMRTVLALCECGKTIEVSVSLMVRGHTKSCGCLFKEVQAKTVTKYNPIIPALHKQYKHMMQRCYNPNNKSYKYYGGSGITICDEWRNNYQNFLDWALAHGWQKGLQIDKDKLGGKIYSPQNCCLLTQKENNQYRRKRGTVT